MPLVQILSYLAIIVFLAMAVKRIYMIANTPVHLRWELYPVPHERGRAHYGGSRLEDRNWWEHEEKPDHLNELKEMAKEILFLKAVWEHNRMLWFGSYPFHLAMYLVIFNIVISLISALLLVFGLSPLSPIFEIYHWVFTIVGFIGGIAGTFGALRLLFSRIADKDLAKYSSLSHYFNIILIGSVFGTFLYWMITEPLVSLQVLVFFKKLITFSPVPNFSTIASIHLYLFLFFMIYMPFTHMTHMFTKYFTYHKVRWEDSAMSDDLKAKLMEQLNYKVTWAAPHVGADGNKTWLAIATEPLSKEDENEK